MKGLRASPLPVRRRPCSCRCPGNRVMMAEVITRAIEAREHLLASGSAGKWSSEQTECRSAMGFQRGVG